MLKKFPLSKINVTKKSLFLLRVISVETQCYLSKGVCGIFHFQLCLAFIEIFIFVQQKQWTLWL